MTNLSLSHLFLYFFLSCALFLFHFCFFSLTFIFTLTLSSDERLVLSLSLILFLSFPSWRPDYPSIPPHTLSSRLTEVCDHLTLVPLWSRPRQAEWMLCVHGPSLMPRLIPLPYKLIPLSHTHTSGNDPHDLWHAYVGYVCGHGLVITAWRTYKDL